MASDARDDRSATNATPSVANPGRRRIAQAGLGATAVLGVLRAKPVLAADGAAHHCSVSGQVSGNMSLPADAIDCSELGRTPDELQALSKQSWNRDALFNTIFGGNYFFSDKAASSNAAFMLSTQKDATYKFDAGLRQVLANTPATTGDQYDLGRAAVASYLNAQLTVSTTGYPLTEAQVIAMFAAVFAGGTYKAEAGSLEKNWDREKVTMYFRSLYEPVSL